MAEENMDKSDFNQDPNSDDDVQIVDNQSGPITDVVNNNAEEENLQDEITRVEEETVSSTPKDLSTCQTPRQDATEAPESFLRPAHVYRQHPNPSRVSSVEAGIPQPSKTTQPPNPNAVQCSIQKLYLPSYNPNTTIAEAHQSSRPAVYVTSQTVAKAVHPPWGSTEVLRQSTDTLRQSTDNLHQTLASVAESARPARRSEQPAQANSRPALAADRPMRSFGRPAYATGRSALPTARLGRSLMSLCSAIRRDAATLRRRKNMAASAAYLNSRGYSPQRPKPVATIILPYQAFCNGGGFILEDYTFIEDDAFFICAHFSTPTSQNTVSSTVTSATAAEITGPGNTSNCHVPNNQQGYNCYWCPYSTTDDRTIASHLLIEHPNWFSEEPAVDGN